MVNSIVEDIKREFQRPNDTLMKLIFINIAIFLIINILYLAVGLWNIELYMLIYGRGFVLPSDFSTFLIQPWTFITSFFSHREIFHILFNMLWMYWFGRIVQDLIGPRRLLNLYILGGLAGSTLVLLFFNTIPYFMNLGSPGVLGASAAVNAIIIGAATLAPNYSVHLFFIGSVKIKWIAAFCIVVSLIGIGGSNVGGDLAHLGGALIGYLYISQLQSGNDIGKPINSILNWFSNLTKPKEKVRVTYKKTSGNTKTTNNTKTRRPDQDEIDTILDKISQSGYDSLSKEEKQKLFNASQSER